MNLFTFSEMEMLTDGGWSGDFMESIANGDEIAIKTSSHREGEPPIKFVTVSQLSRIPRVSDSGEIDYLLQFIGVHASGMREPMRYGSSWAIFRKDGSDAG